MAKNNVSTVSFWDWVKKILSTEEVTVGVVPKIDVAIPEKETVWDSFSERKIKTLHPEVRGMARKFLNEAENQGIKLRVVSGFRDYNQQDALYAKGRTKPGNIVTNAKPGHSFHNFGLAIDVVPIIARKADWNTKDWEKIGAIGKSVGFTWGGDWIVFKDNPHFQKDFGYSLHELRHKYNNGKISDGYVLLT